MFLAKDTWKRTTKEKALLRKVPPSECWNKAQQNITDERQLNVALLPSHMGSCWCSEPVANSSDGCLLHLHLSAPNATGSAPLPEGSRKMSNCSELPTGSSVVSLWLMQTIWKRFATQGCSWTGSRVGTKLQMPELKLSWAGLDQPQERKSSQTRCTYSRSMSVAGHLCDADCSKAVFYSHMALGGPCVRLCIDEMAVWGKQDKLLFF